MGKHAHFNVLCVLVKACVGVGELPEALSLPMPHTAVGRSCADYTDSTGNGDTPTSHKRLDHNPKVSPISGTLSPVKPGAAQPLRTLNILLPKRPGRSWTVNPVECFSGWVLGTVTLWGLFRMEKSRSPLHHVEAAEQT